MAMKTTVVHFTTRRVMDLSRAIAVSLACLGLGLSAPAATHQTAVPTVHIEFFFEGGCDNCHRVENEILPELEGLYGGFYILDRWDIGIMTNYLRLAGYQERLGCSGDADVSMVVNGRILLNGLSGIRNGLFETMDRALSGELNPVPAVPATLEALQTRVRLFTLPGVLAAGLVDGLNPCAIATLVFFISLLALSKISGRQLLLAGGAFCAGSFLTYFAIGLGLLRVLRLAAGFSLLRAVIDLGMIALLLGLAGLSFRDAWRYRRDNDPNRLSLRLPRSVQLLTHAVMRRGVRGRRLILGGFGIGAAVTALESLCTGQVYVPTLALVLRSGSSFPRALVFLTLYNLLFILPLVLILWLTWRGLQTAALLAWSRRNVALSKCLLGLLFLVLASLLIVL